MHFKRFFAITALITTGLAGSAGCELIASVDRSKIGQGGAGGNGGSGGTGGGPECTAATECPGTDDECQARTCTNGVCGKSFTADGTAVTAQTAGDCKQDVCDGAGAVKSINDDVDLPDDGNACTDDVCTNGTPSNPNVMAGVTCGQDLVCDGNGACVGCTDPSQCPGTDDDCKARTCVNSTCGVDFQPSGTAVSTQMAGDCKVDVCDGAGNTMTVDDNMDLPVDNKECTQDLCTGGVPSNPDESAGFGCAENGGSVCDGMGVCVECTLPSHCPGVDNECQTRTCVNNACGFTFQPSGSDGVPALPQTSGACKKEVCNGAGGVTTVNNDTELPDDSNPCTNDLCTTGVPSHTNVNSGVSCGGNNQVCNGNGQCVGCVQASDCSGVDNECQVRTCINSICGFTFQNNGSLGNPLLPQTPGNCKKNVCDGAGGTLVQNDDTDLPVDGNQCSQDLCTNGSPSNPPSTSGTSCNQSGTVCDGLGACVACNVAADCPGVDNSCQVRTCVNHACGFAFQPNGGAGSPLLAQTTKDCKKNVCDGAGNTIAQNDDTDLPVDNNDCTNDVCTSGTPSNPNLPSNTVCAGGLCNGNGLCVQCNMPTDCPGVDNSCQARTCINNTCGINFQISGSPGSPLLSQTAADCKKNVCNGSGGTITVNDDTDVPPSDGNECTQDACSNGVPYPPVANGTLTSMQTANDCKKNVCDGAGAIISQNDDTDVPVNDNNECTQDICNNGVPYVNVPNNTPTSMQTPMDCLVNVCNGMGAIISVPDDTDVHDDGNECTQNLCSNGMMQHPPEPLGTPIAAQTPNDCMINVCDGAGGTTVQNSDGDVPLDDGNQCTSEICTAGVPSHPNATAGTSCTTNGNTCDGAGACIRTFMVVRMGDGSAALGSAATASFIEERKVSDGTLLGVAGNPIPMPTAVAGANFRLTNAGSSTSEGNLSRSLDGKYVVMAGYDADVATAAIAGTTAAAVNRVIGRVGRTAGAYVVNTSTKLTTAFSTGNVRSACTSDGTDLWASGTGSVGVGAIWYTTLGTVGTGTQVAASPNNTRFCHIMFNQLYGSASSSPFFSVFSVGAGMPTTSGQTSTTLAGLPSASGPSAYSFVFFDTNNDAVIDTLYVTDDRTGAATGGIYKYTSVDGINWVAGTPALTNVGATNGARGLTGYLSGGVVTLIASTTANTIAVAIDPLTGATMTVTGALVSAAANTAFRGVALGIQ